jgi:hypothetical protein
MKRRVESNHHIRDLVDDWSLRCAASESRERRSMNRRYGMTSLCQKLS